MEKLKVVLIADLHMGYSIGLDHIQKTVDLVNSQNPDIVCIAGDTYDNDYDAIEEPAEMAKIREVVRIWAQVVSGEQGVKRLFPETFWRSPDKAEKTEKTGK